MNEWIQRGLPSGRSCCRMAVILLIQAGRLGNASAQTETVLYSFGSSPADGTLPTAGLIQGRDGNFYGTTEYGGTNNDGTIFRIGPAGDYVRLYSFTGPPNDGANPYAGLTQASDGNLYGTTEFGGSSTNCPSGCGTVFQIDWAGTVTTLYSFTGGTNGANPMAAPVQGNDGFFYGTTLNGGSNMNCSGCGTVYKVNSAGSCTTLYSLTRGASPAMFTTQAGLAQGTDGCFYGTIEYGGSQSYGSVFKISSDGTFTTLSSFTDTGFANGWYPICALAEGVDGNFYGTTFVQGHGSGTIFQINPAGTLTLLHAFTDTVDGWNPYAGVVQGSDGYFYGATALGGTNGYGNIFRIGPTGAYSVVYQFRGIDVSGIDGSRPEGSLIQGSDGNLYGTTLRGGTNNVGTIFKLTVPLNSPANQISAFQIAGNDVAISIPSVAGETYQLQFAADPGSGIWSNIPGISVTNSIGALLTVTNIGGAGGPQGFYRFAITP